MVQYRHTIGCNQEHAFYDFEKYGQSRHQTEEQLIDCFSTLEEQKRMQGAATLSVSTLVFASSIVAYYHPEVSWLFFWQTVLSLAFM